MKGGFEIPAKIERRSVSDQVFDILKESIVSGKFLPGEKIPSENELTRMLGVSRPSVKAAVERLRAMGLLEIRVGDGSYVKAFSVDEYIGNWADFVMTEKDLSELIEFRKAVELDSLELAVERADEQDIEQLRVLSEKLVEAFRQKDYDGGARYDMEFHMQICRCSKNKYFLMMYQMIGSLIYRQVRESSRLVHTKDGNAFLFDDHTCIYEAIRDRDLERSRGLLEKHIMNRDGCLEKMAMDKAAAGRHLGNGHKSAGELSDNRQDGEPDEGGRQPAHLPVGNERVTEPAGG